jgi:hypothetical protein
MPNIVNGLGQIKVGVRTQVSGGVSYLLDTYGGANTAFSMFKLRTAYSGNCIRVRRSSDNTEQNIGFVNNYLDTASLLSFVGGGNGFVVKWYDQSGRAGGALDLFQTTAANQPQIVENGSIITRNGIATIKAPAGKSLVTAINPSLTTSYSWWFSYEKSSTANQYVLGRDPSNHMYADNGTTQSLGYNSTSGNITFTIGTALSINTFRLMNGVINVSGTSLNGSLYSNGSSLGSVSKTISLGGIVGGYGTTPYSSFRTGDLYFNEFVVWLSNQTLNQSGIESNINSRNLIY